MTLDELFLNVKDVSFQSIVCQAAIQTEADKEKYAKQGYMVPYTQEQFREKCSSVDPQKVYYTPSVGFRSFYYNPETLAICTFYVEMLELDGNMAKRMIESTQAAEEFAQSGNFMPAITCLPDRMRLEFFEILCRSGKADMVKGLYRQFITAYRMSDYGFRGMKADTVKTIFQSKTVEDQEKTQKALEGLPDTLVIYRGGNSMSADYHTAYSWTLDVNTANFFASRRGTGEGYIAKAKVRKCDVIEAFLGDQDLGEHEILVDPKTLHIFEVIPVHGKEFLDKVLCACGPMFRRYEKRAVALGYPVSNESDHNLSHIVRVLRLTQILAEMMHMSQREKNILAKAAIYHDIGRTHDGADELHGKRSAEYYRAHDPEPSRAVELLCEYHCLPDKTGFYEFSKIIHEDPQFRNRKTSMIKLYQAMKDADALDRVRFGLHDLDINQLRLEQSKELGAVARLLYERIR